MMNQAHLKQLISADYRLIALETDSPEQTLSDFIPLVREGKAIYQWKNQSGLSRMEASHIKLPNTKTPEKVLNHIKQSNLFGIYLLIGFNSEFSKSNIQNSLQQITDKNISNKTIIFIDNFFNYPHKLMNNLLIAQEPDVRARTTISA